MSQHDFDIANQTASNARADLNNALKALATLSSGNVAPSNTYPNMLWYDTGNNILKMRNEADDNWINVGTPQQGTNSFGILPGTKVVFSGGSVVGVLDSQDTSDWEAGVSTTESLVSPEKVKASVQKNSVNYGWQQEELLYRPSNGIVSNLTMTNNFNSDYEYRVVYMGLGNDSAVDIQMEMRAYNSSDGFTGWTNCTRSNMSGYGLSGVIEFIGMFPARGGHFWKGTDSGENGNNQLGSGVRIDSNGDKDVGGFITWGSTSRTTEKVEFRWANGSNFNDGFVILEKRLLV